MPTKNDPNISQHPIHFIKIGETQYAYLKKGTGKVILLLHGFPDTAATYDNLLNSLADKGFQAIAPFHKGYYPTDIATDNNYSVKTLATELWAFLQALGHEKVIVLGHDWGASIAYCMANLAPEKVEKLITVAIPHPRVIRPSFKMLYKARHFIWFQFGDFIHWYTRRNNFAYIDYIYRWWSPTWEVPQAQLEQIKRAFAPKGRLEAAIAYYRSFRKDNGDKALMKFYGRKTSVSTLTIAGDSDRAIILDQFHAMHTAFTNDFELKIAKGAGHFVHLEQPEWFEKTLLDYLKNVK